MFALVLIIVLKFVELYFISRKFNNNENVDKQLILTSFIILAIISLLFDSNHFPAIASVILVVGLYRSSKLLVWSQYFIVPIFMFYDYLTNRKNIFFKSQKGSGITLKDNTSFVVGPISKPSILLIGYDKTIIQKAKYDPDPPSFNYIPNEQEIELKYPDLVFPQTYDFSPVLLKINDYYVFVGLNQQHYAFKPHSPVKTFMCSKNNECHAVLENNERYLLGSGEISYGSTLFTQ